VTQEERAGMKKMIVGAAVLVVALVTFRRIGPALVKWAETRCRETMAKCRGDAGTELSDSYVKKNLTTPVAA
jgi:hypothetical protein